MSQEQYLENDADPRVNAVAALMSGDLSRAIFVWRMAYSTAEGNYYTSDAQRRSARRRLWYAARDIDAIVRAWVTEHPIEEIGGGS